MNTKLLTIGGALLGVAVGSAAGYLVAINRLSAKFEKDLAEQVSEARNFYATLYKKDEYSTPEQVLQRRTPGAQLSETDKAVAEEGRKDPRPDPRTLFKIRNGLKYGKPEGEVAQTEDETIEIHRSQGKPYIISEEEFYSGDGEYDQTTYTYYMEDGILANMDEEPVEDVDDVIGEYNLERFGHLSSDENTLHVRNEKLGIDFELIRSTGSYAREVAGFDEESPRR